MSVSLFVTYIPNYRHHYTFNIIVAAPATTCTISMYMCCHPCTCTQCIYTCTCTSPACSLYHFPLSWGVCMCFVLTCNCGQLLGAGWLFQVFTHHHHTYMYIYTLKSCSLHVYTYLHTVRMCVNVYTVHVQSYSWAGGGAMYCSD